MPIDLAELLRNEDIADALGSLCGLEAEDDAHAPQWFTIDGEKDMTVIARDGSGGVFVTTPSSPRVIHASSEGQAGVIAQSVDEFVTLIVACPFWRDLLHFADGGKLEEMRRAYHVLEASWRDDDEDHEATRELLMSAIGITPPDDLVGMLYRSVTTKPALEHDQDGSALESLFGRFTIDRNPMLKPYME
jgi:hypothetical protein